MLVFADVLSCIMDSLAILFHFLGDDQTSEMAAACGGANRH